MKVIVRCANNRVTKSEMEQIIESLFQENKDLRVHIGHLRDELNLSQQQSEARRQVICERDKLIQELNDQIAADEEELETLQNAYDLQKENATINYNTLLTHTKELECKVIRYINDNNKKEDRIIDLQEENAGLSKRIVDLESALDEAHANLEAAADTISYDDELEEQLDHYKKAASIWQEKAEVIQECREDAEARLRDLSNRFIAMYQENAEKENEAREVIANLRDDLNDRIARVDEVQRHNEWLQNEIKRLTHERDTAVNGNAELIEENTELRDNLDAVINIKNEYAETIDEMRKKIVAMQSPEFTSHLAKLIIANLPSTDK